MKERIAFADALKGFAIFCVLWGHALQYLHGADYDYLGNSMYEFIYSFHMPLFFMISGFFFSPSSKDFLLKKVRQLVVPNICWAIIFIFVLIAAKIYHGTLHELTTPPLPHQFRQLPFWFLTHLFISFVLVWGLIKILKKWWLACVVSLAAAVLMGITREQFFLLPAFWVGMFLKRNWQTVLRFSTPTLAVTGALFVVCLIARNTCDTIFTPPQSQYNIVIAQIFRVITGIIGSVFWFMLFQKVWTECGFFSILSRAGTMTMSIYILQSVILERILPLFFDFSNVDIWVYNLIITPCFALIVGVVCIFLTRFIARFKLVNTLLFGQA